MPPKTKYVYKRGGEIEYESSEDENGGNILGTVGSVLGNTVGSIFGLGVQDAKNMEKRISALEKGFGLKKMDNEEMNHHVNKAFGKGFFDDVWKQTNEILDKPVSKALMHTVLPIAVKILAGRIHRLEESGSSYAIAGRKPKGAKYEIAGNVSDDDYGSAYKVAGKKTVKKRKGGDIGLLGRDEVSKPPRYMYQREARLEDLY